MDVLMLIGLPLLGYFASGFLHRSKIKTLRKETQELRAQLRTLRNSYRYPNKPKSKADIQIDSWLVKKEQE